VKKHISNTKERKLVISGHTAKDLHLRIKNINDLPPIFKILFKKSTPISKLRSLINMDFKDVFSIIKENLVAPICYSYGGRGPNIAYGAALLGAKVELISFVGEDFEKEYPGFYDGNYRGHLEKAGVIMRTLYINPSEIPYLKENHYYGVLIIRGKETPTIYCVKDVVGNDFYLIDDIKGAHVLAEIAPIPKRLIRESDGILITSGEPNFNKKIANYAYKLNKEIYFDIGAYRLSHEYLIDIIPKCDIIFGNYFEINMLKNIFNIKNIHNLFLLSDKIKIIIEINKIKCLAKIFLRNKDKPIIVGPLEVKNKVSSVGCCDGFIAGFLAFYSLGYKLLTAVKAGLMECTNIWRVEGVQEGMLSKKELLRLLKNF